MSTPQQSMNNKIGDVANFFVNALIQTGEDLGANRKTLFDNMNLTESMLTEPGRRLGLVRLMKTGHALIEMTGEPAIGLISGQRSSITSLGYPGLLAMNASSLGEALHQLCAFEPLISRCNRGSSQFIEPASKHQLRFYSIAPYNTYNMFVVDCVISGWNTTIKWLTGKDDLVDAIFFEYPEPAYFSTYAELFPCPVYFRSHCNAIQLKAGAGDAPVLYHNAQLFSSLRAHCYKLLEDLSHEQSMGQRVQKAAGGFLHDSALTLEDISQKIGVAPWTLRRRLTEEGLSFQMILNEMRKDLAINYVRQKHLSFGEIAYKMGFSNTSAFQRAFKRWTKQTPGNYRANSQETS